MNRPPLIAAFLCLLTCALPGLDAEPAVPDPLPAGAKAVALDTGETIYVSREWVIGGAVYKTVGERELRVAVRKPVGWRPEDSRPAFVFLFGGGFHKICIGPEDPAYAPFLAAGCVVVLPEYRLARGGVTIEAGLADAKSAIRWVRGHAAELGVDPERIIGSGESAGGFLAAAAALTPGHAEEGEDTAVSCVPDALCLLRPVVDITAGRAARYRGKSATEGAISPALHLAADAPPTWIIQGTADGFLPESRAFAAAATGAGATCELVEIEDMSHTARPAAYYRALQEQAVPFLREAGVLPEP